MSIAVVILNWNGLNLLKTYLPSVVKYSKQAQIYVVDNASTDTSIAYVKSNFPDVKCIQNAVNTGYAGGYNTGLKYVDEDIFILLNNDVEVTKEWLEPIKNIFETRQNIAVIQPKILDARQPSHFEYAGAAGGFIDYFAYPYCRGRIFSSIEKDIGQYDKDAEIFWASGACMAVRKNIFREVGGFDETYFAHQEEIDLCWRIFNRGLQIWFCHQSVIYHLGGATLDNISPQKTFLNFRNSLFNILKNTTFPKSLFILVIRLILDGLACLRFLFSGQWKQIFAVLRAHFSFYRHCKAIFRKRQKNIIKHKNYYKTNSIIYQYFILGHKRFRKMT